jgi:lipopolysaccharide/colanic/teichoic acid biosynthesis glycosyltransferase
MSAIFAEATTPVTAGPAVYARWRAVAPGTRLYESVKRASDLSLAGLGLLLLSPLFVLLAIAIKLESPGPVLFSQIRIGQGGVPFRCWKFRSMQNDAERRKAALMANNEMAGGIIFKMKCDPRITRVGRLIRKASLDELPQLWNVLMGEMSLVGPRPPLPQEVATYSAYARQRLMAKPGITCFWQVSGRSETPFGEQVRLDIEYISKRSLLLDLSLLIRTVPAVLLARGAC